MLDEGVSTAIHHHHSAYIGKMYCTMSAELLLDENRETHQRGLERGIFNE